MEDLVKRIIIHSSPNENAVCWIEEMSELIKVICKLQRKSTKFNENDLKEELAHVMLSCEVIKTYFNIPSDELYAIQLNAVERMEGLK